MTEHTPAPWFKSAYSDSQGFKIKPKNGRLIAIVKEQQTQRPYEAVHNACLIAAAPELLSALEDITAGLNEAEDTMPLIRAEEVRNARKAIAKAKGEL